MNNKNGDHRVYKDLEYHEKHLKIAKEIGDWAGEGGAYGNLGNAYDSLGDYQKAIKVLLRRKFSIFFSGFSHVNFTFRP